MYNTIQRKHIKCSRNIDIFDKDRVYTVFLGRK